MDKFKCITEGTRLGLFFATVVVGGIVLAGVIGMLEHFLMICETCPVIYSAIPKALAVVYLTFLIWLVSMSGPMTRFMDGGV